MTIWKILLGIWRPFVFLGAVIGLLYLPSDIQGLPAAYGHTWEIPMWLDRETGAFILLAVAWCWIFWIDVRPFVQAWWRKRQKSSNFTVLEDVYCETFGVSSEESETGFFENVFYLVIANDLETGQTLKCVQARIFHIGSPTLCLIKDSKSGEVDVRHGEWAYFQIGRLVSKDILGSFHDTALIEESRMRSYNHNIPLGYLSFKIDSVVKKEEYGMLHRPEHPIIWNIFMVISADDVRATQVRISIDMTRKRRLVSCELIS